MSVMRMFTWIYLSAAMSGCSSTSLTGGSDKQKEQPSESAQSDSSEPAKSGPAVEASGAGKSSDDDVTNGSEAISCVNATDVKSIVKHFEFKVPEDRSSPDYTCRWNENGNVEPINAGYRARREEVQALEIPAEALICDFEFNFPPQPVFYDDQVLLAFNDRVILSGGNFTPLLESDGVFLKYAWPSNIIGRSVQGVYCPGLATGESKCAMPIQERAGTISLDLAPELVRKLGAIAVKDKKYLFKLVTFGDNDSPIDCRHSPISFSVAVKYVEGK